MPDLINLLIPLGVMVLLGYGLGRFAKLDLRTIATLAIYGFTPIVGFGAAAQVPISAGVLALPVITFVLSASVGLSTFALAGRWVPPALKALLPMASGSGNTGYFGFPIALALLGPEAAGVYLVGNLGVAVYEVTVGYYCLARTNLSVKAALLRVVRLPMVYALAGGLLYNAWGGELPTAGMALWSIAKNVYLALGMVLLGLALAQYAWRPQWMFASIGVVGKLLLWPLAALGAILLDAATLQILPVVAQQCLMIMALAPAPSNLAAFAVQTNARADQATALILVTTVIAVALLPWLLPLALGWV